MTLFRLLVLETAELKPIVFIYTYLIPKPKFKGHWLLWGHIKVMNKVKVKVRLWYNGHWNLKLLLCN